MVPIVVGAKQNVPLALGLSLLPAGQHQKSRTVRFKGLELKEKGAFHP
jgi:hypothetical protein